MTSFEAALRQIDADLTRAHVSFALVGGLAVSVRTEPRFTRDADLAVALASDAEAEALIDELCAHDFRMEAVVEQEAVGRLATVRLTRSSELQAPVIDLLFASSGIEREVVAEAEPIELLPNLTIGVARTPDCAQDSLSRRRQASAGSVGPSSASAGSHHLASWYGHENRSR